MDSSLRIRLIPNQHPEIWVREGPRRQHFFTTFSALVDLLRGAEDAFYQQQAPWQATPVLPPGACYYAENGTESWTILDLPPTRHAMTLETSTLDVFLIPLPRCLFAVQHRGDRVLRGALRLVATADPLTDTTPLYHYPLSNVYPDGRLCWRPPDQPWPLTALPDLIRSYFATPHNFDLYHAARNHLGYDLRHLMTQLAALPEFPVDWLVPAESFAAWRNQLHS